MKKATARKILQEYIDEQITRYGTFYLPIKDVIVYEEKINETINNYTFVYLMSVAYGFEN